MVQRPSIFAGHKPVPLSFFHKRCLDLGTIVEGPLVDKIDELKDKIISTLGN